MKKTEYLVLCIFLLFALSIASCTKKNEPQPVAEQISSVPEIVQEEPKQKEQIEIIPSYRISAADYDSSLNLIHADSHQKYLQDEMIFTPLSDVQNEDIKTAVAGSNTCMFYPIESISTAKELKKLPKGENIPIGTILEITGTPLKNDEADEKDNGLFKFQDNLNWFYKVTFNGKKGIVFGSDLEGLNENNTTNLISSMLYKSKGRFDSFFPICGFNKLEQNVQEKIQTDRLAFQSLNSNSYKLDIDNPDDMLALYLQQDIHIPHFITTDLFSHTQHLIFDNILQQLEEKYFFPKLTDLCDAFINKLEILNSENIDKAESIQRTEKDEQFVNVQGIHLSTQETIEKALLYFKTAKALSADTNNIENKNTNSVLPQEKKLNQTSPEIQEEVSLINDANGYNYSSVFSFSEGLKVYEDYSQYKPRGHYTKSKELEAYFRMMMWFGHINFPIADIAGLPETFTEETELSEKERLSLKMTAVALLINDIISEDEALFSQWKSLFEPVTYLIGKSDDLSFSELLPFWKTFKKTSNIKDEKSWITNSENLIHFAKKAVTEFHSPSINETDNIGDAGKNMGWKLFGQRFTYDSWIHNSVCAPKINGREMVTGLDIMKVLGSQTAELLLNNTEYQKYEDLKPVLDSFQNFFNQRNSSFWNMSYYNNILLETTLQTRFEPGTGFYFTETPAWGLKSLLTSHGTWAELRHDTILYVKQVSLETALRPVEKKTEPTFRTDPIPEPVHYIEPNVSFFKAAVLTNTALIDFIRTHFEDESKSVQMLEMFNKELNKASDIAQLELEDKEVSEDGLQWIKSVPETLSEIVLSSYDMFGTVDNTDNLKMAVIADIYTHDALCLESGIGQPYRIYIALNDKQGGKRIAEGYIFSYYEFPCSIQDRLTDEQWKKEVYDDSKKTELEKKKPYWSQNITTD